MAGADERYLRARDRSFEGLRRSDPKWASTHKFTFVQLADTQFGMMPAMHAMQHLRKWRPAIRALTCSTGMEKRLIPIPLLAHPGKPTREELIELEKSFARCAVQAINAMRPRPAFAVVCGDLVHAFPESQPEQHAAQVAAFKAIFREVHDEIALVCTCGNHDVGERPTAATLAGWRADFGDDYFAFWVGSVKFLALNSQLYKDASGSGAGAAAAAQEAWLDRELALSSSEGAQRLVVFSHIPPFISSAHEPSGYFPLARETRLPLLAKLARAGVTHWFAGHYHRNAGGVFCLPCDGGGVGDGRGRPAVAGEDAPTGGAARSGGAVLEVVTTAAVGGNLGTDPQGDALGLSGMLDVAADPRRSGLRVVHVDEHTVEHRFVSLAELMRGE